MPVVEYLVANPSTSAELEAQALTALRHEDVALKGLLNVVVRAKREVPAPVDEPLLMRIRRREYADNGHATTILGETAEDTDPATSLQSDSIIIRLSEDPSAPASAHIVTA